MLHALKTVQSVAKYELDRLAKVMGHKNAKKPKKELAYLSIKIPND